MFSIPLVVACVWGGIEFNAASPTCGTCSRSEPNTVEADVVYHWTGSMEPKSLYVHSVISGISLHTQRRVFLNKTYLSHWGWGPATQKSSGRFMCEWKTPGTEEEEPSHPSLHANTRARFTDVSSPSSCAAKASNSFSGVTTWCLITRKSTGGGLLLQLPERPPSPWRISSSDGAAWALLIFLFAEEGLVTWEETRGSAAGGHSVASW